MDYDLIASAYDKQIKDDLNKDKLELETVQLTGIGNPQNWRLLDIGCGSGLQVAYLAERFPEMQSLIGIDDSENLIKIAREKVKDERCRFEQGSFMELPVSDNNFDFVYSRYTLHYTNELETPFKEIERVCKPGGNVFIMVVHPVLEMFKKSSKDYNSREIAQFNPQSTSIEVKHVTHKIEDYINAAIKSGLHLINIEERFGGQSAQAGFNIPSILILRLKK
ncbi:MAG: class I SAM-dependent methyltransferase [Candidatus Saccharimonadales bacterium]